MIRHGGKAARHRRRQRRRRGSRSHFGHRLGFVHGHVCWCRRWRRRPLPGKHAVGKQRLPLGVEPAHSSETNAPRHGQPHGGYHHDCARNDRSQSGAAEPLPWLPRDGRRSVGPGLCGARHQHGACPPVHPRRRPPSGCPAACAYGVGHRSNTSQCNSGGSSCSHVGERAQRGPKGVGNGKENQQAKPAATRVSHKRSA